MAFVQALPHYCPPDRWNEVLLKLREESCSSWEALGVESMCVVSEVSNWGGMQDDTLRLVIMRLKDADSAAGFAAARPEALEDAAAISEETCRSKFEKASAEGWVGKLSAEQFAAKFSSMNGGAGEVMKELRAADLSEASFADQHYRPRGTLLGVGRQLNPIVDLAAAARPLLAEAVKNRIWQH
eukprot:TRINITY_DN10794_c0_g1_i1.p1 TRINITY_DN10794_c0_g1~~TRINITY_DN10794_c0_g1_i1.p1  ORF type:complete len:215 (-),score=61.50 TRINITY_DN10794_c0_g1_i1:41-592(-)